MKKALHPTARGGVLSSCWGSPRTSEQVADSATGRIARDCVVDDCLFVAAIDLIVWSNEFNVVQIGVDLQRTSATPTVRRTILMDNAFDLARDLNSIAIRATGSPGTGTYFEQFLARKNVMRADPSSSGSTSLLKGMAVENIRNAVVENNLISDCENGPTGPLSFHYCTTFKAFNNQNRSGTLLHAYDTQNSRYLMELQDFTEDPLIGF